MSVIVPHAPGSRRHLPLVRQGTQRSVQEAGHSEAPASRFPFGCWALRVTASPEASYAAAMLHAVVGVAGVTPIGGLVAAAVFHVKPVTQLVT